MDKALEHGTTLQHKFSGTTYSYMGEIPGSEAVVIVDRKTLATYSVEKDLFVQYYIVVPDDIVRWATYEDSGGSQFRVEAISPRPDGEGINDVVFGFKKSSGLFHWHALHMDEESFRRNYTKRVDRNA